MGSLTAFACGDTSHGMHQLLQGAPRERRVFPANVFLHEHGDRRVLFDTGYAPEPWRAGLSAWAYRRLLPPRVPPGASIGEQLDADSVTHVVLSHLHPDHVGGIAAFPAATVVLTEGLRRTLDAPRVRDGVLGGLVRPLRERVGVPGGGVLVVPDAAFGPGRVEGLRTADLFDDGSYLLVDLPGHAVGHVGALVEHRVLLAADAAWGREMLGEEHRIRAVPRAVAADPDAQARTAVALRAAEDAGTTLLFSHDRHPTGVDLLRGGPS